MKINEAGLKILKESEGLRLKAYLDSESIPTIGWGHTRGVDIKMNITEAVAVKYLLEDVGWAEIVVGKCVKVPINDNQFSALVSLVFNIGAGAFMKSTLLSLLNKKDYAGASKQFLVWNKGGSGVLPGLVTRRAKEKKLFDTKV